MLAGPVPLAGPIPLGRGRGVRHRGRGRGWGERPAGRSVAAFHLVINFGEEP